jgi:hypothetical protein
MKKFKFVMRIKAPEFEVFLKLGRLMVSVHPHNVGRWNFDRNPYLPWAWKLQLPFIHIRWWRPIGHIPGEKP